MKEHEIHNLIKNMTLEQKAGLCSGEDYWHTKAVAQMGIPRIMMADGPNGLRKQDDKADHLGINESIKAVCFPSGCAAACSFDRSLLFRMGETLGKECRGEGVSVLLGPAINIKRSPLCGRNFEYFSEDPVVAGELGAAQIRGIQSQGVSACVKHYLANNQEHRRMSVSAEMDERTLHEMYLLPFEIAVKKGEPWAVMSSYNRVNGEYVAESYRLLTRTLRSEWGFDGCVISDWGGTADRVTGLSAGLDLEMPTSHGINDALIVEAVKNGSLSEEILDQAVERILKLICRSAPAGTACGFDLAKDHDIAREIAEQSMVLLKNERNILPLAKDAKVVFIGEYAVKPRYQGGGSGHINTYKAEGAFSCAQRAGYSVSYAQGFEDGDPEPDEQMIRQAVETARKAEAAVIFAGLPEAYESEGFDREHMRMPRCQNELIRRVAQAQPNTVVVLHNGAPVEMPWDGQVAAVLEAYLAGEAVGEAAVRILYGAVNPSGRLAETVPMCLEDNPSYLFFPGEGDKVEYREGIFIGYRYYGSKNMKVRYPFGHGLSYTTFDYRSLRTSSRTLSAEQPLEVCVDVTNTGTRAGREVVQLYVSFGETAPHRPQRELREFAKVCLEPGETKTVTFTLEDWAFAQYHEEEGTWRVKPGEYTVCIARNAVEVELETRILVEASVPPREKCTLNSLLGDLAADPLSRELVRPLLEKYQASLHAAECCGKTSREAVSDQMVEAMVRYMPLRSLVSLGGFTVTREELIALTRRINAAWQRAEKG